MANRRQQQRAVTQQVEPEVSTISTEAAPAIQPPMDAGGHLAGALAIFALAVALFVIVLVMIAASNA